MSELPNATCKYLSIGSDHRCGFHIGYAVVQCEHQHPDFNIVQYPRCKVGEEHSEYLFLHLTDRYPRT